MTTEKIEKIIEECRMMASESVFNLDKGFYLKVNYEKYVDLLESLLRSYLSKIENE